MDEKLIQFVDHARDKGMDHATIRQLLLSAGWPERIVADVLCSHTLEIPIPTPPARRAVHRRGKQESVWPRRAREAFLYLLTFGALFSWATSLILLYFVFIDFAFPDPAWRTSQAQLDALMSVIRVELAVLIVAFPVYLILWHFLLREVRRDSEKSKGAIRRWLAYLSIFIGAVTISGDVMTLIYFLLEGQLTTRLLLKSAVLLMIAGSWVVYLTATLRSEAETEVEP